MLNRHPATQQIILAIERKTLVLPTIPEVAIKIRNCAEDSSLTPIILTRVISTDPALSASFIKLANSAANRGQVPINTLSLAITRLGTKFVIDAATGLAMRQIFKSKNQHINEMMYSSWAASTHVAAYAHVFAKNFSDIKPEVAALAGLMHLVGALPILTLAQENEDLIKNTELLLELIKRFHASIGSLILTAWKFNSETIMVPSLISELQTDETQKPNLIDVIQAAIIQTQNENNHFIKMNLNEEAVYKRFNVTPEKLEEDEKFQIELEIAREFYCQF